MELFKFSFHVRAIFCLLIVAISSFARAEDTLNIAAAASLKNAIDEAALAYQPKTSLTIKINYGGSMTLAKQIEAGAPADLFISADEASMDYLVQKNLIQEDSRLDLLSNNLVLVAPANSPIDQFSLDLIGLKRALNGGKLVTGEVNSVPVGIYAKQSLHYMGLWDGMSDQIAMTDNVRAALAFVDRGEAPLGIVYGSDAVTDPNVKILLAFPDETHLPIRYPIALGMNAKSDATGFLAYLKSSAAADIFRRNGFLIVRQD